MTIPNPDTNNEKLCFVTIVFPIANDQQIINVKHNIEKALVELPKVKIEYRITEVRNNGIMGHQTGPN